MVSHRDFQEAIWVFPKIRVPQNGWFTMENPIKMDDLWVPLFSETLIYFHGHLLAAKNSASETLHGPSVGKCPA